MFPLLSVLRLRFVFCVWVCTYSVSVQSQPHHTTMTQQRRNAGRKDKKDNPKSKQVDPLTICPDCGTPCEEGSDGVECDLCEYWFHGIKCQGMKQVTYQALCDDEDKILHWYCKGCKRAAQKVNKKLAALQSRQDSLEDDINTVKDKVSQIEEGTLSQPLQKAIEEMIDSRLATNSNLGRTQPLTDTQTHRGKTIDRSCNLLMFREEENPNTPDTDRVNSILKDKLKLEDISTKAVTRIGEKVKDKVRPILITLQSQNDRNTVLKKLKQLREAKDDVIHSLFITPDLSKSEREKQKELRQQLKSRRDNGEPDLVIRRGKIVQGSSNPTVTSPTRQ